ncbi:MAG: hypothetical protein H6626_08890 [Pseudobdellovibrionaceae bacterium]|nr:hypothetical protein [Bdellovibrionales bacterium]USN46332.1 MAG: hypothetical protein H6626_08890 [Pseudobdellovibrionaceae bacterium]
MRPLIILAIVLSPSLGLAKKVEYRKTQKVDFDAAEIDGEARTPDGAYLHQKRGVDFLPLYKIRKQFDKDIKNSVEHLR